MTPAHLLRHIDRLDPDTPRHKALECALHIGVGYGGAWYSSQKEHWQRWLAEYHGPGAYGRKPRPDRTAQFVYNRIQCAPMLFWLAEAAGVSHGPLERAYGAVLTTPRRSASQCGALRQEIQWSTVRKRLIDLCPTALQAAEKSPH